MNERDDIIGILQQIPHRYPFLLVDRVLSWEPAKRLTAIKNVTINEPFFGGHFPAQPVMPAVLILAAMAQAGLILAKRSQTPREAGTLVYFAGIDRARFKRQVVPGDQLRLEVEMISAKRRLWRYRGEAWVGDALAATADLMAVPAKADGVPDGGD
ncbi:MAG: 3-hydroxyacyl-ACP dehydratase FabZ [Salinisphaera sp.]|nr:3-hydroxyacyl-ACP dehydratase FabZ [Salinisphaera sp.]